ncbi:MAG: thermonuclease family protein [Paracoccus sp. (in: a-proteobacteria)]
MSLPPALKDMLRDILPGMPATEQRAGDTRVIDGDTLEVAGTRVRLFGIDAPEAAQTCRRAGREWACGTDAGTALVAVIAGRKVTCEKQDTDRYGRMVGICWAGSENLNAWMVQNGWAVAYRQYGGKLYDPEEILARVTQRGMWGSEFVMPWDWRKGAR